MSGPERSPPDDELLSRHLDGQGEVSRAYRQTAAPAPPVELDRRILDMARRELQGAGPAHAGPRRGDRWRMSFAAAAVIVLSVGVLLNLRESPLSIAVPEEPVRRPLEVPQQDRRPAADAAARASAEERAAAAPPAKDASVPIQAQPQMLQQKAEGEAERKRQAESEAMRRRLAADAPATLLRSQAATADGHHFATPSAEASSCQAPDVRWSAIRRLLAEQHTERARGAYRDLLSECPDLAVPEDLRARLESSRGGGEPADR